jgi:alcohol dehydrogenase, propanol-preferring
VRSDDVRAKVLTAPGAPHQFQRDGVVPGYDAVRVKSGACGVCLADPHVVDGERSDSFYPINRVLEVADRVEELGRGVTAQDANEVLSKLRSGQITGAAVLQP